MSPYDLKNRPLARKLLGVLMLLGIFVPVSPLDPA